MSKKRKRHPPSKQLIIEFALDLEENEEHMGEHAALAVTCAQYGIDCDVGYDWLINLPDGPWWLEDARLTPQDQAKKRREYEAREKKE